MPFCPFATVGLLAGTSASRPAIRPTQIVVHTMESTPAAADRRFRRADARGHAVGQSHFGIGCDGRIVQWIDTMAQADATYQANRRADATGAIAVSTEGLASQPWTDAQLDALVRLHVWLMRTHRAIGRRMCRSAADPGLGHHALFGAWTGQATGCPGPLRMAQWREMLIPRVLAAFGVRYGEPTPEQLAEAFVEELVGEEAKDGEQVPDEPRRVDDLTGVTTSGLEVAETPSPAEAPPIREPGSRLPHASPAQIAMHAVRDFFLPDSAPNRKI